MFAIMALAAAAAGTPLLQGPVPSAPIKDWLAQGADTPAPLRIAESGTVNFALTVSPEGQVIRCGVEGQSGSPALDAKVCVMLVQRGQFRPALDSAGKPAVGVYRGFATWASPTTSAPIIPLVEMAVGLQKMPQGFADPTYVDLVVSVDAGGNVDGCATGEGLDLSGLPVAARLTAGKALGSAGCAEAVRTLKLDPVRNAAGAATPSIQTARILFTADATTLASRGADTGILVAGRKINDKVEAKITSKGFAKILDYQAIGSELVMIQAEGGRWYRMTLEPPCIGNSRLTRVSRDGAEIQVDTDMIDRLPRELRNVLFLQQGLVKILPEGMMLDEGLGFTTHTDGSIDRNIEVVAITIDAQDIIHIESCRVSSMVESSPPTGFKGKKTKK